MGGALITGERSEDETMSTHSQRITKSESASSGSDSTHKAFVSQSLIIMFLFEPLINRVLSEDGVYIVYTLPSLNAQVGRHLGLYNASCIAFRALQFN